MHDSSRYNRQATFSFILLALKYLEVVSKNPNTEKLLLSLDKHWEPLFFFESDPLQQISSELKNITFAIKLAFWLARPYVLSELIDDLLQWETFHPITVANALFCLIELGSWKMAQTKLDEISQNDPKKSASFEEFKNLLECAIRCHTESLEAAAASLIKYHPKSPSKTVERVLLYIIEEAINSKNTKLIQSMVEKVDNWPFTEEGRLRLQCYLIWAYLLDRNWTSAGELLHTYPIEVLSQETSLLHFLYGCWLEVTEGKEISTIHFSGVFEAPYPRTWTLFSSYLSGKINNNQGWIRKSFLWERKQLYRQLALYYYCIAENDKAIDYQRKAELEVIDPDD
jgi:serine/threonine-protein kinase